MSITDDLRDYADSARENILGLAVKAQEAAQQAVTELLTQAGNAEKAVRLDELKAATEPYLSAVVELSSLAAGRAEQALAALRSDQRLAGFLANGEAVVGVLGDVLQGAVEGLVVKPIQARTGFGTKPSATATDHGPVASVTTIGSAPTTTRRAPATKSPATKAPATKAAANTAATKAAANTAAKKAPAKKAPAKKAAAKAAATKAPAKKSPAKKATARASSSS